MVTEPHAAGDAAALLVLEKYPDSSVEFLRGPLSLSHSGCVRLVDRLERDGLVERREGSDARSIATHLTRKGRDAASSAAARREDVLVRAFSALTAKERETFGTRAAKIVDRAVVSPRGAMRACRLCDYGACVECPMHKFASGEKS